MALIESKYFESTDVQVFPCSYRGSYADNGTEDIFDPESRMLTEANMKAQKLRQNAEVTIISCKDVDNKKALEFFLHGYHFRIADISELDETSYIVIKVKNVDIINNGTINHSTEILDSFEETQDGVLDKKLSTETTAPSVFTGLVVRKTPANSVIHEYGFKPLVKNSEDSLISDPTLCIPEINAGSGECAITEGVNTTASGNYSHAEGAYSTASGAAAHAEGEKNTASGDYSHAEGTEVTASGTASHAEGYDTRAAGDEAHAEGDSTVASGEASHAEGCDTTSSGYYAHAEGYETTASGSHSHAEGSGSVARNNGAHAEGESTVASGDNAHAEGWQTSATNSASHAEGAGNIASGPASHAEGGYGTNADTPLVNKATARNAHAEGESTEATGANSHTEGKNTKASGENSHAEGEGTEATRKGTHAGGYNSKASGDYAFAHGRSVTAGQNYQTVIGQFNANEIDNETLHSVKNLFEVGCGTEGHSANAFGIDKNGNTKIYRKLIIQNPEQTDRALRNLTQVELSMTESMEPFETDITATNIHDGTGGIVREIIKVVDYGQLTQLKNKLRAEKPQAYDYFFVASYYGENETSDLSFFNDVTRKVRLDVGTEGSVLSNTTVPIIIAVYSYLPSGGTLVVPKDSRGTYDETLSLYQHFIAPFLSTDRLQDAFNLLAGIYDSTYGDDDNLATFVFNYSGSGSVYIINTAPLTKTRISNAIVHGGEEPLILGNAQHPIRLYGSSYEHICRVRLTVQNETSNYNIGFIVRFIDHNETVTQISNSTQRQFMFRLSELIGVDMLDKDYTRNVIPVSNFWIISNKSQSITGTACKNVTGIAYNSNNGQLTCYYAGSSPQTYTLFNTASNDDTLFDAAVSSKDHLIQVIINTPHKGLDILPRSFLLVIIC